MRRVTLGLDFGTSATKCCFREQAERKLAHIVGFEPARAGDSRLLLPTTIAVDRRQLFFGHNAEHKRTAQKVRSFKMCLLCLSDRRSGGAGKKAITPCPNCIRERPGFYRIDDWELSAEDISTLYLAYVIQVARRSLFKSLGGDPRQIRLTINSAGPLDQMSEFGNVGERFERSLFYGSDISDCAKDGWPVDEAMVLLARAREKPVPSLEQRLTRVFPETHAAMTAYILLPQSEPGLYGLIDIGAGTTDVAFFWLQKDKNATKVWYYAAGSRRVGMDDVDLALRDVVAHTHGNVRAGRELLSEDQLRANGDLIQPIATRIRKHQAGVLSEAMNLDQRPKEWFANGKARYRLFLAGGGSLCEPIVEHGVKKPLWPNFTWQAPLVPLVIPPTTKVALPNGHTVSVGSLAERAAERLLLLACGLAHPRPDIPKFERDVEGVKSDRKQGYFELPHQWW